MEHNQVSVITADGDKVTLATPVILIDHEREGGRMNYYATLIDIDTLQGIHIDPDTQRIRLVSLVHADRFKTVSSGSKDFRRKTDETLHRTYGLHLGDLYDPRLDAFHVHA